MAITPSTSAMRSRSPCFDVGSRACGVSPFVHPELCDVNRDGQCNIGDALAIARCDVGQISCVFNCLPFSCP
jgi:hypothetical protein